MNTLQNVPQYKSALSCILRLLLEVMLKGDLHSVQLNCASNNKQLHAVYNMDGLP